MAQVIIEDLCKSYPGPKGQEIVVVDNINLVVEDEEFVILVGASGCGKSTTLRMVAGLEEISKGQIYINKRRVNDVPPKDRDIAMVFQNYALYPHMTVYNNMAFGLQLRKYPTAEIEKRVRDAAQILGFTDEMLKRKPKALSGGQRQRVALGRAIVRKPAVFLLDEPLSNLDAKMRVQMRAEISKLHNRLSSTMIYVTHDQVEAMTMGDRIVVMKGGHIQQVATPLDLYHDPANAYVASFIGSPAMNFIAGKIKKEDGKLCFLADGKSEQEEKTKLLLTDEQSRKLVDHLEKQVLFGIRPESLQTRASETENNGVLSAIVEMIEPLGSETYVYLKTSSHNFVARFTELPREAVGHPIKIAVDMTKGYFFEAKNQNDFVKSGTSEIDIESWHASCKRVA